MIARLLCLLLYMLIDSMVESFSETIVVRRRLPYVMTPEEAYRNVYQAWKQNLGLWFVPPPFILDHGDPDTGVGFVLMRIPPLGLKEGIVGQDRPSENSLRMTYKVLNPSPFTWPVQDHLGEILLWSDNDKDYLEMEWTVRWTPLGLWIPFFADALKAITKFIIEYASTYMVELCESYNEETQRRDTEF